jgi:hypothetical protein
MSGPNTHGAFIQLPGGNAFIDGITDTCKHDYSDSVFITKSGKEIFWHTYRQWAHLPSKDRDRLIQELHYYGEKSDDPIVTATCQCRKCKKIYEPNFFTEEF